METRADRRCNCGMALREWRYTDAADKTRVVWAGDLADVVDYQIHRPTRHDVLDGRGRRVQRGTCAASER